MVSVAGAATSELDIRLLSHRCSAQASLSLCGMPNAVGDR